MCTIKTPLVKLAYGTKVLLCCAVTIHTVDYLVKNVKNVFANVSCEFLKCFYILHKYQLRYALNTLTQRQETNTFKMSILLFFFTKQIYIRNDKYKKSTQKKSLMLQLLYCTKVGNVSAT